MTKKHFALLAICLFFLAIITSACGGGGKTTPPSYPFIPVTTPTPTVSPTPTPTISPTPEPTPEPTVDKYSLELSQTEFTINIGATDNITVTLNGEDITQTATYTVDQEAIATVECGLITGISAGVATVTVHYENAESDKTFTVNVIDQTLPNLELSQTNYNLFIEDEATITVKLNGEYITENATYTTDNDSIATAEKGIITTGTKTGTTTITISYKGANSATFTVSTNDEYDEEIELNEDTISKLGYQKIANDYTDSVDLNTTYYDLKKDDQIITQITIPAIFNYNDIKYKITSVGYTAFWHCSSIKTIKLPQTITEIKSYPTTSMYEGNFNGCVSLENVNLPNNIENIGSYTFYNCQSLKEINLPDSIKNIGRKAFNYCNSLKTVIFPENLENISKDTERAFAQCKGLETIDFSKCKNLTTIGDRTFIACTSLKEANIPDTVTSIGTNAFAQCSSLKTVHLPANITRIKDATFNSCSSLERLDIPDSVTYIGYMAFYKVKHIYYTDSETLKSIEGYPNWGANAWNN